MKLKVDFELLWIMGKTYSFEPPTISSRKFMLQGRSTIVLQSSYSQRQHASLTLEIRKKHGCL